jgi:NagD protein
LTDKFFCSIVAGITSEIDPVLVLSGVTTMDDLKEFAYGPYLILGGVYEIPSDDESHRVTEEELEEASRRVSTRTFEKGEISLLIFFTFIGFFIVNITL